MGPFRSPGPPAGNRGHRQHYGDFLVEAIAANPPRQRGPLWAQRDLKIISGRATPEDLGVWAQEAKALADEENRRVTAARRTAWSDWVISSWNKSPGKVHAWRRTERPAPIFSTTDAQVNWLLEPNGVHPVSITRFLFFRTQTLTI